MQPIMVDLVQGESAEKKLKCGGLINLGCTCYLNTTLQCIAHCTPFLRFITESTFDKTTQPVAASLQTLSQSTWIDGTTNRPREFMKAMERKIDQEVMFLWQQNDAMEFLLMLIDVINTEVGIPLTRQPSMSPTLTSAHTLKKLMKTHWINSNALAYSDSFTKLFYGQNVVQVRCRSCKAMEHQGDIFASIHVALDKCDASGNHQPLAQLISNAYACEEVVRTCDACGGKNQQGTKSNRVWMLPSILMVSIKRFDKKGNKLNHKIHVPININLDPISIYDDDTSYTLKAIACHAGWCSSGHYYSIVRQPCGTWLSVDDDDVYALNTPIADLDSTKFYALFYERTKTI